MKGTEGSLDQWAATRRSFDTLADTAATSRVSFTEAEMLRQSHWTLGQDARLREDVRFRPTPWGRWILASTYLANDALFAMMHVEHLSSVHLENVLSEVDRVVNRRCAFCPSDPRFVFDGISVRFAAKELTEEPVVDSDVAELEKYVTHLPVHSLRVAAASEPASQWGRRAQEEVIDTLGWMSVIVPGQRLNPRMFVAQIEGHSMDDGRRGLVDGAYCVFELWPSGTKQNLEVVVRGAFSDPETGAYALKKYVADTRNRDGRHQRITLVSLNRDKTRFPDIQLKVEQDEDVVVVAKVVHALSPHEFERRPKPLRRPGRRDLVSKEAVQDIEGRLVEHLERFFESLPQEGAVDVNVAKQAWGAEMVCLDAEAGGPHLEVSPLVGLWSFVKQLRVEGHDWHRVVLASNLRQRLARIRVPLTSGPWRWSPVDFEDDSDVDLSGLSVVALEADRVHVFRVDADGIGRKVSGHVLSAGQRYRVVVHDSIELAPALRSTLVKVDEGWRMWDFEVSAELSAEMLHIVRKIGLDIGDAEARLEWVLVQPVAWRFTPRGESYPCFLPSPAPVIAALGPATIGDARLFVRGLQGMQVLPLSAGPRSLVSIEALVPGRYSALFLHERNRVAPARLFFEVVADVPASPRADWSLTCGNDTIGPRPVAIAQLGSRDLALLDALADTGTFVLATPPGWPVRLLWREIREDFLCTLAADSEGRVDVARILSVSVERRTHSRIGDLVIDMAELGAAVLRHERRLAPDVIRGRVGELIESRGGTVERLAGAYMDLMPLWFKPICAELGYDVEAVPEEIGTPGQEHVAVFRLLHTERQVGGNITRHGVRLLVLVEDLKEGISDALTEWIDNVCGGERLREVLISDGLRWASHRRASRLALQVKDLSVVSKTAEDFVSFLHVAAEGV